MKRLTKEFLQKIKTKLNTRVVIMTIDELSESNRTIKFVGSVFIITGALAFSNKVILNDLVLTSLSLSGIFFIVADFFEYTSKEVNKKEAIPSEERFKKRKKYAIGKALGHFLAILTLIIGPYLNINPNTFFLDTLSDSLSLIAIGLTVVKIGMDNASKKRDSEMDLFKEFDKILNSIENKK